jgi:hypothetical protein
LVQARCWRRRLKTFARICLYLWRRVPSSMRGTLAAAPRLGRAWPRAPYARALHYARIPSRSQIYRIQKFQDLLKYCDADKNSPSRTDSVSNGIDRWPWKVTIQLATRNFPRAIEKSTGNSALLHKTANFPRISASIDVLT